ncbi:peptidase U32 family protein [Gorillibacterium sp. CAU 1737]|uniref:peptidase U32 family protein n=1 Tax=Gorillibacterium sp. CAU 1737 TaxID=3140362 RepID=UPI0032609969
MRLSVSTNFDNALLEGLKGTRTTEVYGKLAQDIFGGGRPPFLLPDISREEIREHVELAHSLGLEFNYLLNGNCMGNLELTDEVYPQIFEEIDWLREIKVDWVTVSLPFLVDMVKRRAPEIRVDISTFAYVDTFEKAKRFEQMGADRISLPVALNRNFKLLSLLRNQLTCDLRLLTTSTCLASCPYRAYHDNCASHLSQTSYSAKGFPIDYSTLKCTEHLVKNPVEVIKAPWIRPEDLHYYEKIGIDNFKITERSKTTDALLEIVNGYNKRRCDGDFARFLNFRNSPGYRKANIGMIQAWGKKGPEKKDAPPLNEIIAEYHTLIRAQKIELDNRELDGFLSYFATSGKDCRNELCGETCKHCYHYADKALHVVAGSEEAVFAKFEAIFEKINSAQLYDTEACISTRP